MGLQGEQSGEEHCLEVEECSGRGHAKGQDLRRCPMMRGPTVGVIVCQGVGVRGGGMLNAGRRC